MLALLLLIGCFPDPAPAGGDACVGCHGSEAGGPAPPSALGGFEDPSHLGVGAHQAHVNQAVQSLAVPCTECHLWPDAVEDEGHTDTPWPAEVVWGELAKTGGATLPWDREAATCTVYCHGATLTGGQHTAPDWTSVDGSQVVCGSCHGNPPPPPHSIRAVCADCHGATTPATHIDGTVQCWTGTVDGTTGATPTAPTATGTTATTPVDAGSCADLPCALCHGTEASAAPPPDVMGNTDPSARGVGAHDVHLAGTATSAAVPCWTCHVETHSAVAEGHIDPAPAEVVMSGVAASGGVSPWWDPVALTCGNGCHSLAGAAVPEPVWTTVDGSQSFCGSCHGMPPPAPHPAGASCETCHAPIGPATHVNGQVDF